MVILIDLNSPVESVDAALWEDAPLDTVMLIAASRGASAIRNELASSAATADDPPDDDAYITWEDAEWQ